MIPVELSDYRNKSTLPRIVATSMRRCMAVVMAWHRNDYEAKKRVTTSGLQNV